MLAHGSSLPGHTTLVDDGRILQPRTGNDWPSGQCGWRRMAIRSRNDRHRGGAVGAPSLQWRGFPRGCSRAAKGDGL